MIIVSSIDILVDDISDKYYIDMLNEIKFEIKNRWTGSILFEYEKEDNTLKDTVEKAVKEGANLEGAYLRGVNLRGAYIYISGREIDVANTVKNFEEKNNIKITDIYINKNIIPTRWNCLWKYGLIICDYDVVEKEEKIEVMTLTQVCKELGRNIKIIKED